LRARHQAVDLDGVGAFDLDCSELGIIDNEVLALGDLVAAAFVLGGDRLTPNSEKSSMSTATNATLIALGERFEKLLREHMDAWLTWAPRMRAARAEVEDNTASLAVAIRGTRCDVAQARISELERDMQRLAEEIIAAPATSLGGLRAKALVALWEAYPTHASHEGAFEFRDDGSRSLFEAVAVMTGLSPLVRELEARLAADVE
jgi:hypothetical protein